MFSLNDTMRYFLCPGRIDMRKGISSLCVVVYEKMKSEGRTPDNATLESREKNLVDWYSSYLISIQEHLKRISNTVVCDAFFSKATFIKPLCANGLHVIIRFRNDAVLFYPTLEKRTGKRGRPKLYGGKIDFENPDFTRCTEYKVNKGILYGLKAYSKTPKRFVSLAVWYPMDGRTDKWGSCISLRTKCITHRMFWNFTRHVSNSNFAFVMPSNMPE